MNGHCFKDIVKVLSTHTTMENIFVLIFSLFREYVFGWNSRTEGRKTELANAIFFFYEIAYFSSVSF